MKRPATSLNSESHSADSQPIAHGMAAGLIGPTVRSLLTISMLGLGWYCMWRPVDASIYQLNSRIDAIETLQARGPDLLAQEAAAEKRLTEQEAKSTARKRIPETVQVTEFEDELNALARECGLHRVRIQAAEPQLLDRVTTVTITLEAGGEYPALCGFLDRLQSSSRLCPLSRLKVTRPSPDAHLLEIELTLRIFAAPMDTAQAEGSRHD